MELLLLRLLFDEFLLSLGVDVGHSNGVILARLPVDLGRFSTIHSIVHFHLLIMMLQVTVCHHIVVSLRSILDSLASESVLLGRLRAFLGWLEVVVLHVDVADDVVVHNGVLARSEVPRLILGVVRAVLKTLQFVIEVQNVVGLLVAKCLVLVFSQDFGHVSLFDFSHLALTLRVAESLSDGVVLNFLGLYVSVGHLAVRFRHSLEVALLFLVLFDLVAPVTITVLKSELLVCLLKSVTFCRHFSLLQT